MCIGENMQNYTHLTAKELEHKWQELIGYPVPPPGRGAEWSFFRVGKWQKGRY